MYLKVQNVTLFILMIGVVIELSGSSESLTDTMSISLISSPLPSSLLLKSSGRGRLTPVRGGAKTSAAVGTVALAVIDNVEDPVARDALFCRDSSKLQSSQSHSIVLQSSRPHPM